MPNQPKTKVRSVRVPDEVWDPVAQSAQDDRVTVSDVVRDALETPTDTPPHSCQHAAYQLSCDEFDALMARAGGKCELCRTQLRRLHIDHDHAIGWHGVRGLLCPRCNAHMRRVDADERNPDAAVGAYLALAWHKTQPLRTSQSNRTPLLVVRVPRELQDAAKAAAERRGETVTAVVNRSLRAYVARHATTKETP